MSAPEAGHEAWIEEARRRHERWVHGFLAALGLIAAVNLGWSALLGDPNPASAPLAALLGAWGLTYAALARRGLPARRVTLWRWLSTSFEVSLPLLVMVINAQISAKQALMDTPAALWVITILLSVLRLTPALPMWAGVLAAAEWMAMYLWLAWDQPFPEPSLQLAAAWRRTFLLAGAGLLAARVSSALLELTHRIEAQTMERERVRRAFGSYVAAHVVDRVLSGDLQLRTERRALTVMFVDIRGFTSFAEAHPPQEVVDRLNQALDRFAAHVQAEGGMVNKFLGDGLMALFGAPDAAADHAQRAVSAALAIRAEARELARSGAWTGLRIGVGVHTGEVLVGDIGGERQREYTAIGDAVNVASRVEGMTKEHGVELLITAPVAEAVRGRWEVRPVATVKLRGREGEVGLFSVADPTP